MLRHVFLRSGRARLLVPVGVLVMAGALPASIGLAAPIGSASLGQPQLQTTQEQPQAERMTGESPTPSINPYEQARQIGEQVGQPVGDASSQEELRLLKDVSGVSKQTRVAEEGTVAPSPSPESKSESTADEFRVNKQYLLYGLLGVIAVLVIVLLLRR